MSQIESGRKRRPALETRCARGPRHEDPNPPLATPIVTASTFGFESLEAVDRHYETGVGHVYTRYANPTVEAAEAHLAAMEGAEASALFGSGMAAISTTMLAHLKAGDTVAVQRGVYGGTDWLLRDLMPRIGVQVRWLDPEALERLVPGDLAGVALLHLESPVNPTLGILDLERLGSVAREAGVTSSVDSTFAPPVVQRPVERGIDLVIHSATKYLGGHSDLTAGAVSGDATRLGAVRERRRQLGGILDPQSAFLLQRGFRSLAVRMERHQRNALAVAHALESHPAVERVLYPGLESHPNHARAAESMDGFGAMVSFTLRGGAAAARRLHDGLDLFVRAGSLGGVESLVSLPCSMSHRSVPDAERRAVGVVPELVRLSVGLEAADDLIADLTTALDRG